MQQVVFPGQLDPSLQVVESTAPIIANKAMAKIIFDILSEIIFKFILIY
jgi:hypothetical protein